MKCSICSEKSVYLNPSYCKKHFIEYFEKKVESTIKRFNLIKKNEKVGVAVSGGKDSTSLLVLLNKLGYSVVGLAIDEGIYGYRDEALKKLIDFCKEKKIKLKIISFNKKFGQTLDNIIKKRGERPCSVCGVLRRYLLNYYSKNMDLLATGHNMDDEAQAIIMNLAKGNLRLLERAGPASGNGHTDKFTKRVKPFYFCSEKEIMAYSFLIGLNIRFNECPYVENAFRLRFRDILNDLEIKKPGTKEKIINWFLKYKSNLKKDKNGPFICERCGEPSAKGICNTCLYLDRIRQYK